MTIKIFFEDYYDKVLAAWLGKSIGGTVGACVENQKAYHHFTEDDIWPSKIIPNDDLDLQLLWLEAMQEEGLELTSEQMAKFWQQKCWYNFCEYGVFLNNIQRGIWPPLSGQWNNDFFGESEGCVIRSEIWGLISPGNPALAASMARKDAVIDHYGLSVDIEAFWAAAMSAALIDPDLDQQIKSACSVLDLSNPAVEAVAYVKWICSKTQDHKKAWRLLIRRYGHRDASKAITNHAIVLLSLWLGRGDFKKTLVLAVNSGWDTDCTAATAGALLGASKGLAGLPGDWVEKVGQRVLCGIEINHKEALFSDIAKETCFLGLQMAKYKNSRIQFLDSPHIESVHKNPPRQPIEINIEYSSLPVLRTNRPTLITIKLINHTDYSQNGKLMLLPECNADCIPSEYSVHIEARCQIELACQIKIKDNEWIKDKNLFSAIWQSSQNHRIAKTFGLVGARRWLVYGPYWDMWDVKKYKECPYNNNKIKCLAGQVGLATDYYNQYAFLDKEYLDEGRLLHEDIPDEMPTLFETGEDIIRGHDISGFRGQCCYYLTRTICSEQRMGRTALFVGRSSPYRLWIDGELISEDSNSRCWAMHEDEGIHANLTGQPQRVVIKITPQTEDFTFSLLFIIAGDKTQRTGISYIYDGLSDKKPPDRCFMLI